MTTDYLDALRRTAQQILDEIWSEHLIPFQLTIGMLSQANELYIVYFYDSRLFSVAIPVDADGNFPEVFRATVLAKVAGMMAS